MASLGILGRLFKNTNSEATLLSNFQATPDSWAKEYLQALALYETNVLNKRWRWVSRSKKRVFNAIKAELEKQDQNPASPEVLLANISKLIGSTSASGVLGKSFLHEIHEKAVANFSAPRKADQEAIVGLQSQLTQLSGLLVTSEEKNKQQEENIKKLNGTHEEKNKQQKFKDKEFELLLSEKNELCSELAKKEDVANELKNALEKIDAQQKMIDTYEEIELTKTSPQDPKDKNWQLLIAQKNLLEKIEKVDELKKEIEKIKIELNKTTQDLLLKSEENITLQVEMSMLQDSPDSAVQRLKEQMDFLKEQLPKLKQKNLELAERLKLGEITSRNPWKYTLNIVQRIINDAANQLKKQSQFPSIIESIKTKSNELLGNKEYRAKIHGEIVPGMMEDERKAEEAAKLKNTEDEKKKVVEKVSAADAALSFLYTKLLQPLKLDQQIESSPTNPNSPGMQQNP